MAEDLLGHSLALVEGDLVFQNNQFTTVSALQNLMQALELRILTPFGSDRFNANYGLDIHQAFTESGTVNVVKELIKLNLVRTLTTDPRVRDVRSIMFEDDPEYRSLHPDVTDEVLQDMRHRRAWRVYIVIETITDQSQTFGLTVRI